MGNEIIKMYRWNCVVMCIEPEFIRVVQCKVYLVIDVMRFKEGFEKMVRKTLDRG